MSSIYMIIGRGKEGSFPLFWIGGQTHLWLEAFVFFHGISNSWNQLLSFKSEVNLLPEEGFGFFLVILGGEGVASVLLFLPFLQGPNIYKFK
jgi:hypothetical protein